MTEAIVRYDLEEAAIVEMEVFLNLTIQGIEDKAGFASVHDARMTVKGHRVTVETRRKELKADALDWGRRVDAEAKRLKGRLAPIEAHLQAEEDRIGVEKTRIKKEAALKARAKVQSRIDAMAEIGGHLTVAEAMAIADESFSILLANTRKEWEAKQVALAEEKRIAAEKAEQDRIDREAEEKRLAGEREALAEEKAKIEAEREKNRLEQEAATQKLREEADALQAEKDALDRAKALDLARAKAVQDEKDRVERERLDALDAKRLKEEALERREALRPDRDKLEAMATEADSLAMRWDDISLSDDMATEIHNDAARQVEAVAEDIRLQILSL
jgi:hypothetical protein